MNKKAKITFKNVSISYNKKDNILESFNFSVDSGDFISIFGKNGCGKTSLIKAISGIIKFSGDIYIDNKNIKEIKKKDLAKKISYISQTENELDGVLVMDYLLMSRFPYNSFLNKNKEKDFQLIETLLKRFNLLDAKEKYMEELSGGQKQIISILCGIAQETDILLIDEPTNHLDPEVVLRVFKIFEELKKEGKTIILISHSLNDSIKLSNKILLIKDRKLFAYGNKENIIIKEKIEKLFNVKVKIKNNLIENISL